MTLFGHSAGPRRIARAFRIFNFVVAELRKAEDACRKSMVKLHAEITDKQKLYNQLDEHATQANAAANNIQKLIQPEK